MIDVESFTVLKLELKNISLLRICTTDAFEEDMKMLTETLILNGFPLTFTNQYKSQLTSEPILNSVA